VPGVNVPFRLVDVFTLAAALGNQLCVVPEPDRRRRGDDASLAKEIGFSETTFVTEAAGGSLRDADLHAGAGAAVRGTPDARDRVRVGERGRVSTPATQVIAAGEIPIEVDVEANTAWMTQLPAEFSAHLSRPRPDRERDRAHDRRTGSGPSGSDGFDRPAHDDRARA
jgi:predicted PhzF superfamily epimerase YddE/YHI9